MLISVVEILEADARGREDGEIVEERQDNVIEKEANKFLGVSPSNKNETNFVVIGTVADRIKVWSTKGLTEKKGKTRASKHDP